MDDVDGRMDRNGDGRRCQVDSQMEQARRNGGKSQKRNQCRNDIDNDNRMMIRYVPIDMMNMFHMIRWLY